MDERKVVRGVSTIEATHGALGCQQLSQRRRARSGHEQQIDITAVSSEFMRPDPRWPSPELPRPCDAKPPAGSSPIPRGKTY